jgi:pyrroloquinoline quinone biosynthesis protein E
MKYRPYLLLAELTHQCPLHCPYCSNPSAYPGGGELATEDWRRVIREAAELGVYHVGFSGGEPLLRADLPELARTARAAGLYTNLITSGVGLSKTRAEALHAAGLDSAQLSFQADEAVLGDAVAGARVHQEKLEVAGRITDAGLSLSLNVVLHRANIERLPEIIALAESLRATRLELANVQFYGWAFLNRLALLPSRQQVEAAFQVAMAAKQRLAARMDIFYVLPDYYEERPKPCMQGWGQRYLTVNPVGEVLPCPTASSIPGLRFENVRERSLASIWFESESFNRFRGTEWMPAPCRTCPQRELDFGGCRCQAALLTGDASATDPVCTLGPSRGLIDKIIAEASETARTLPWIARKNPLRDRLPS